MLIFGEFDSTYVEAKRFIRTWHLWTKKSLKGKLSQKSTHLSLLTVNWKTNVLAEPHPQHNTEMMCHCHASCSVSLFLELIQIGVALSDGTTHEMASTDVMVLEGGWVPTENAPSWVFCAHPKWWVLSANSPAIDNPTPTAFVPHVSRRDAASMNVFECNLANQLSQQIMWKMLCANALYVSASFATSGWQIASVTRLPSVLLGCYNMMRMVLVPMANEFA